MADIREQWNAVLSAPLPHALAFCVVAGVTWGAMEWRYGGKIDRLEAALEAKSEPKSIRAEDSAVAPSTKPPFPAAQIGGTLSYGDGGMPIRFGVPLKINIGIKNKGPGLARNVKFLPQLAVAKRPAEIEVITALDQAYKQLELVIKGAESQDLQADEGQFATLEWTPSKDEITGVLAREYFLYVHLRYEWEDSTGLHYGEVCRYLNSPTFVGAKKDEVQFAYCTGHNRVQ